MSPTDLLRNLDTAWIRRANPGATNNLHLPGRRGDTFKIPWPGAGVTPGQDFILIVVEKGTSGVAPKIITSFPVDAAFYAAFSF